MNVTHDPIHPVAFPAHGSSGARCGLLWAAAAFALAILVAGCSNDDKPDTSVPASTSTAPESTAEPGESPSASASGPEATGSSESAALDGNALGAIAIAVKTTPGVAIEIDRGTEQGQAVWEVVVRRADGQGVEHHIAVATGGVLKQEPARIPAIAATLPAITIEQALAIAAQTVPDSELVEADLDTEGSRTVWEVEVRQASGERSELHIDATTGEVSKKEPNN